MKLASLGLLAVGLLSIAPAFAASTTHSLSLSATVTGICKFNTAGPTAVTIANSGGAIDPTVAVDATGTANVLFRCTTGTTSAISANNGSNFLVTRRVMFGALPMPYSLALAGNAQVGSGHGAGQDKTLAVTATIIQADFINATAGAYTDTVVLTITP